MFAAAAEDLGRTEYHDSCAICHGETGKGDGPYASFLKTPVPDLTTLQKRNNGVFPFNRAYEVIDGREAVKAHGPRDMPIWGDSYTVQAMKSMADFVHPSDAEGFVRGRILALISYVYGLQEK